MRTCRSRQTQSGFSMIEVLIAIVILAIGLLGFALLQTLNLRYTQGANARTQATNLGYTMLDQMRANRLAAAQYTSASFNADSLGDSSCDAPSSSASVVARGIGEWKCQVYRSLGPSTAATVTYSAAGIAGVRLSWDERGSRVTGATTDASTSLYVETQL